MSIELKVMEKAIAAKDFDFLSKKIVQKLRELAWTDDDVQRLAEKLAAAAGRARRKT